ncbi:hypothetical protein [Mucilaginibacter sp. UYNi724]
MNRRKLQNTMIQVLKLPIITTMAMKLPNIIMNIANYPSLWFMENHY